MASLIQTELAAQTRSQTLRNGGKILALGCLSMLTNEFSCPNVGVDEDRIEKIGRHMWTHRLPADATAPHLSIDEKDDFWKINVIAFPQSWPEKCMLPVSVNDPSVFPNKFRLLAFDELVLSFWKFVGYVVDLLATATAATRAASLACGSETPPPESGEALEAARKQKLDLEKLLQKARSLHRNVPFTFIFCDGESARYSEALSLREDIEVLREYVGLTGWHRIVVVGSKRDELRSAVSRAVKAEEVAQALATVRWAPGREITVTVAEKLILLYDKFASSAPVVALIAKAQRVLGRSSPFEEYSKLLVIAGKSLCIDETLWIMSFMFEDQKLGKVDGFSKAEMTRRHGTVLVYLLRKRLVDGLIAQFTAPARRLCAERSTAKPVLKETADALETFEKRFVTVEAYMAAKEDAAPHGEFLPQWCAIHLARTMRQAMEGLKDKVLTGILLRPPKGGAGTIRFSEHLCKLEGIQESIAEVSKGYDSWEQGVNQWDDQTVCSTVTASSSETKGASTLGQNEVSAAEQDKLIASIRTEISDIAKEMRQAFVSVVPIAPTVLATTQIITSSSVYKTARDAGTQRLCFIYVVACVWNFPRLKSEKDSRKSRPLPMLPEDLAHFGEVIDKMVTADNECYACVIMGRSSRPGSGMAVEAGVLAESQVINIIKDKSKGTMRVKRFRLAYAHNATPMKRGVSGILSETAFFFYRGSWPSKRVPSTRSKFGGSTWDDCWNGIPATDEDHTCHVPYSVKKLVFEDIWSSRSGAATGEPKDDDDSGDDAPEVDQQEGQRKRDKRKKDKSKKPQKQNGKEKGKGSKKPKIKKDKVDATKRKKPSKKQDKSHLLVNHPGCLAEQSVDTTDPADTVSEPLFHNDYHGAVWSQIWKEWSAKGAVVFSPGNGNVAVQAVHDEFPILCLVGNTMHGELLNYFTDCKLATAIQIPGPDNRLHDPDIKSRARMALDGKDESSDEEEPEAKKVKNKNKLDGEAKKKNGGKKKGGKTSENECSSNSSEQRDSDESSGDGDDSE